MYKNKLGNTVILQIRKDCGNDVIFQQNGPRPTIDLSKNYWIGSVPVNGLVMMALLIGLHVHLIEHQKIILFWEFFKEKVFS